MGDRGRKTSVHPLIGKNKFKIKVVLSMKMLSNVEITKVCEEYLDEKKKKKLIVPVKVEGRLQKALG